MKTLVIDDMPNFFWNSLSKEEERNVVTKVDNNNDVDVAIIRTKTIFTEKLMNLYPNLKLIIRAGSGYDNIDCLTARKKGIMVCNTPEANSFSAFEHTISFIFALLKQLDLSKRNVVAGKWKNDISFNYEISDLKLLVVGVGRIGKMVGNLLKSLGAQVKGVDPYIDEEEIELVSYTEGLKWCNMITYHCQLHSETHHYFNERTLSYLDQKVWLVNVARGNIVDLKAIEKGLFLKKFHGVALDVFPEEPFECFDFLNKKNVLLSPHLGGATLKAKNRMSTETIEIFRNFRNNPKLLKEIDFRFVNFKKN